MTTKAELLKAQEKWKQHCETVQAATAVNINETEAQRLARIRHLRADYAAFVDYYFPHWTVNPETGKSKIKHFGWAISNWGTQESRLGRISYPRLREYMFAALIARTDVDLIALDKGEIKPSKVVDQLIAKMEEYANFGFDYITERLEEDPNFFFKDTAFIRIFLEFLDSAASENDTISEDEEPESLD